MEEKPFNCLPLSSRSNESLEFLGDGVLDGEMGITKQWLYRRFSRENEGFMNDTNYSVALAQLIFLGDFAFHDLIC